MESAPIQPPPLRPSAPDIDRLRTSDLGLRTGPNRPRGWRHLRPSRHAGLRVALVLFLAFAVYVVGSKFMGMAGTLATLSTLRREYLVPILLLALVYYVLKALRWHYYL